MLGLIGHGLHGSVVAQAGQGRAAAPSGAPRGVQAGSHAGGGRDSLTHELRSLAQHVRGNSEGSTLGCKVGSREFFWEVISRTGGEVVELCKGQGRQERSLEERVQIAAVICAWGNAKTHVQRAAEVDAEYDTQQWSRPVVAVSGHL